MNYDHVLEHLDAQYERRMDMARDMVRGYPHYSDEMRKALLDSIDGAEQVRQTALKNAHEAMEEAFNNRRKDTK